MAANGFGRGDFVKDNPWWPPAERETPAKGPYEEANRELSRLPRDGMSLTQAVEQIRRKPRSERLSGELNTPELRKRDADG